MDVRGGVQRGEQREQIFFAGGFGQDVGFGNDAEVGAGFFFASDVNFGGGVFADAHEGEAGSDAAGFEGGNAGGGFRHQLRGNGAAVNEVRRSH